MMIILLILNMSLIHCSLKVWENVPFGLELGKAHKRKCGSFHISMVCIRKCIWGGGGGGERGGGGGGRHQAGDFTCLVGK